VNAKILVVDDEVDLVEPLVYRLEREGFQVLTAYNGAQALELALKPNSIDLILLDLMLPDMRGTEICKALRANQSTSTVPVIMLTALGEEIDRVLGFEMGADDYVVKPFSLRELVLRIRAVLRRGHTPNLQIPERLSHDAITIDMASHQVWNNDKEVKLTAL